MAWGVEFWGAVGNVLSGLGSMITAGGVLVAGWYFFVKKERGYHVPNLSPSVSCERSRSGNAGRDHLAIRVTLKKGERGTLGLLAAAGRVTYQAHPEVVTFWGCNLAQRRSADGRCIDWTATGGTMNITPGEETQFATATRVPAGVACQIDVAVLALQYGETWPDGETKKGQWQASTVSLPIAPNEALQPAGAAVSMVPKASVVPGGPGG